MLLCVMVVLLAALLLILWLVVLPMTDVLFGSGVDVHCIVDVVFTVCHDIHG